MAIRYDYRCVKECGYTFERDLPMADRDVPCRDEMCAKCGAAIERYLPSTQGLIYNGNVKVPDAYKDVLRRIHKNHAHSQIHIP